MILRRVIAHFRRQEWAAIFLDFVIVVIGVFVGLQAQEWSKNFSDRQREAQIIAGLIADLDIDRAQYAQSLVAANPPLAATIRIMATFVIYHRGEVAAAAVRAAELQANLSNYLESIK